VARYKELTADERERMIAEAVEKQRRDRVAEIEYAKDEGLAEGRAEGHSEGLAEGLAEGHSEGLAEGRVEGLAEGRADEQCEIARRMKAEGVDQSLINKVTGLTQEEVMKL
jgi:flagellar biosynthesis/type III secretory pathway protein FliH